jgi:hypothetical protein
VEAREVPAWTPAAGPLRSRTWTRGEPLVEVYTAGKWRPATLVQRQDRADGMVTYHVMITPGDEATGAAYRVYAWDPRSVRPVREGTADPIERTWS